MGYYRNMTIREKLHKKAKTFPNIPGVYIWRDSKRKPIYIGRAGSLKKRIASYFRTKDDRINEMVSLARSLSFQKTDTLLEAVILEANLIKKHWPKYNVKDKDNRSFVYLVILPGTYPKPKIIRGRDLEKYVVSKAVIFGPYQSYRLLRMALDLIRKIFPFSVCKENSKKACFHYQIGLCPGVCINQVDKKEYKENIRNLKLFFKGDKKRLLSRLKKENKEKLKALKHIGDVALLSQSGSLLSKKDFIRNGRIEGYDISHHGGKSPVGAMVVFESGEKDPTQYRLFNIKSADTQDDLAMLQEVVSRRLKHSEWKFPDIVFVDGGQNQVRAVNKVLKEYNVIVPVVGLSKSGIHSAASSADKLVILNAKKVGKELLIGSKKLFQQIRNEAHRFAIKSNRRKRRLKK